MKKELDYYLTKEEAHELCQSFNDLPDDERIYQWMRFNHAVWKLDWAQKEAEEKAKRKIKQNWEPFVI